MVEAMAVIAATLGCVIGTLAWLESYLGAPIWHPRAGAFFRIIGALALIQTMLLFALFLCLS